MVLAGVMMAPSTCVRLTLVCKRSTPSRAQRIGNPAEFMGRKVQRVDVKTKTFHEDDGGASCIRKEKARGAQQHGAARGKTQCRSQDDGWHVRGAHGAHDHEFPCEKSTTEAQKGRDRAIHFEEELSVLSSGADFRLFRPASDEIHYQVPHVMRHPHFGQSSPRLFFKAMCSAINSASTSSLV